MIVTTLMNTIRKKIICLNRRHKMRFREKLMILFIAVMVTILGFNMIALDAVHMLQESHTASHVHVSIDSYMVELDVKIHQIP